MNDQEIMDAYKKRVAETLNEFREVLYSVQTSNGAAIKEDDSQRVQELKKKLSI